MRLTEGAFLWDDSDQDQWTKITRIMVHQRNRWIHSGQGFNGTFDAPWSEWYWITDPVPNHPKGTSWLAWVSETCVVRRASCVVRRASCVVRRASCVVRRASCVVRRASCVVRRASCVVRRASCVVRHDSFQLFYNRTLNLLFECMKMLWRPAAKRKKYILFPSIY